MHFNQAVAIIQSQIGIIKGVQVIYSDTVSINRIFVIKQLGCSFNALNKELFVNQSPIIYATAFLLILVQVVVFPLVTEP